MAEAAVQKGVRDQLPDGEVFDDVDRNERQVSKRPVQPQASSAKKPMMKMATLLISSHLTPFGKPGI